jgi:Tfp pilus assembly protein PilF
MPAPTLRAALAALLLTLLPATARADLRAAREALTHGDYPAAEAALRTLRPPERAAGDRLRARLLLETGRYDEARLLGERLARTPASRPEGLIAQGEALVATGDVTNALARWEQAIAAGPPARVRRAQALAAWWYFRRGNREGLREAANPLVDAYNDATEAEGSGPGAAARTAVLRDAEFLTYVGLAARALGATRNANEAFNQALRIEPARVETNLEQAELMLTTEDYGPAGEALRAALGTNPRSARALALRARARLLSNLDFTRAGDDLAAAEAVNPRLPAVFALRAAVALRDGLVAEADRQLDAGAAINPRDLEVLAMRGVVRFFADDRAGFARAFDAVFEASPTYAEAYETLSDYADWEHRYAEAIDLMREGLARPAIAADRKLGARLRASLGINLLRLGREEEGLAELRASYEASRFNVRVTNLLNLYEQTMGREYITETVGPFRLRYHREERPVLSRYVPALLQTAYDDMVRRYGFTPEGPLSIELYASDEHFSVRTSGLPEIGVQGVCFGRVVTAISPRGGPFNWAQIVWHELAHVFAIQRSRARVPRWFTEGLSEWEAFHSHPAWAREDDPSLARALADNRIPRVADFNTAFTHARRAEDMLVAYYAASKLVEFMIDRYGFPRVAALLPLWGEGLTTPEVIQRGLGVSADAVDAAFRAALQPRLARYQSAFTVTPSAYHDRAALTRAAETDPQNANAQASAAAAALFEGDGAAAAALAERAVRLDARVTLARWVRARLALEQRQGREALEELDALFAANLDGYGLRLMEAQAARAARDDRRVEAALTAAVRFDPLQHEAHRALAGLYQRTHREADRLGALRAVVRLDQHDREALGALLEALVASRGWAELNGLREHANHLDPESVAVHLALAHAAYETGDTNAAVFEYESALALAPSNAAAIRARVEAVRRGQRGLARIEAPARPAATQGHDEGP